MNRCAIVFLLFSIATSGMDNPVAPIADAGVFKHRGRYYIMGVRSGSQGFWSTDLVHWRDANGKVMKRSPGMREDWRGGYVMFPDDTFHVFSHYYLNGVHHIYGSGGESAIAHAIASSVTGPFSMRTNPFAPGIDPAMFRDEDGRFYFYSMVHVPHQDDDKHWGNNIWVQQMSGPGALVGRRKRLLWAEQAWELLDHRIAEGPHVIRYRGLYYMFYNSNHTSHFLGNYTIGVVAAKAPDGFRNESVRPVVLKDNVADQAKFYRPLVHASSDKPEQWWYTTSKPVDGWYSPVFDHSTWKTGVGGFGDVRNILREGRGAYARSRVFREGTKVKAAQVYLRKTFQVDEAPCRPLCLLLRHYGHTTVFLNGKLVYRSTAWLQKPRFLQLGEDVVLTGGANCLAVQTVSYNKNAPLFVDIGLYEMLSPNPVDYIYNCGQPNPVRGPNGFEWWMGYFGIWNGSRHAYGFDRIHFHGPRPVIEGPTCRKTPGYHPPPSLPTFAKNGSHALRDGATYRLPSPVAEQYLIEFDLRFVGRRGLAGVRLGRDLQFAIDAGAGASLVQTDKLAEMPLIKPFACTAFHHVRIERNARYVQIWVDDVLVTRPVLAYTGPNVPEFFANGSDVEIDGILHTIGWDEHGARINGWGRAKVGPDGLVLAPGQQVVKGDLMAEYEFSAMVSRGGAMVVGINDENFLWLGIHEGQLKGTGKLGGRRVEIEPCRIPTAQGPRYFRLVKLLDRVIVFVDSVQMCTVKGRWPPARVGLSAGPEGATFNHIQQSSVSEIWRSQFGLPSNLPQLA